MDEKNGRLVPPDKPLTEAEPPTRKRGRPKVSTHDRTTQKRLSVQRYRQAKRESEEVPVEIYLPKEWHDWLINSQGVNLREAAVEAFADWMKKKGFIAGKSAG